MLRRVIKTTIAILLLSMFGQAQSTQTSMKGYELYSWKVKGHWYYSLLPGTNRLKTYEEITAPGRVKRDSAGLKIELQKLSRGEEVFWRSDGPAGGGSSGPFINVKHPSRARIKEIRAICARLGVKLTLT